MTRNSEARKRHEAEDKVDVVSLEVDAVTATVLLGALNLLGHEMPATFASSPVLQQFRKNVAIAHAILRGNNQ